MSFLQQHLCTLLRANECVIIPELGGFVVNVRSASLNRATHRMEPPRGEVGFNARLFHNDGVFAQHLRMVEGVSYDKAMVQIRSEVAWIQRQLESGRKVVFEQVGALQKGTDSQLVFYPFGEVNFLPAAFGLEALYLTPVTQPVLEETPVVPINEVAERRRAWRNLAAAAFIPALVAGSWFLQQGMEKGSQLSILPGNLTRVVASYAPRYAEEGLWFPEPDTSNFVAALAEQYPDKEVVTYSFHEDVEAPDGVRIRLKAENKEIKAPAPVTAKELESSASKLGLYYIVGGAFKQVTNAEALVAKLRGRGHEALVFEQRNGLHYVAFGSYATREAAVEALEIIRTKENRSAWLKRL